MEAYKKLYGTKPPPEESSESSSEEQEESEEEGEAEEGGEGVGEKPRIALHAAARRIAAHRAIAKCEVWIKAQPAV